MQILDHSTNSNDPPNHSHWRSIGTKHVNNGSIQCTIPHLVKGTSTVRVRPKCLNGGWFRESIHNYVPLERQSLLPLCHSQTNVSIQYQSVTNLWPISQSNANLKSICQFIINPSIRYRSWTNPAIHRQSITNPPILRQTLTPLPIQWTDNPGLLCQSSADPRMIPQFIANLPILDLYLTNPASIHQILSAHKFHLHISHSINRGHSNCPHWHQLAMDCHRSCQY